MFAEETKAAYREDLKETVYVRRYTGVGQNRPFFDSQTRADVMGDRPEQLVGTINQYDYRAIVFVPELVDGGFALPITSNDKLVWFGKEYSIIFPDNATIREDGELIAYRLNIRGQ